MINYGVFKGETYTKKVSFSKAVLWFKRQLSLRADIMNRIKNEGIKKIVFIDDVKGEKWIFKTSKVLSKMVFQGFGQEEQYYFPIDICKKEKFDVKPQIDYVFDKKRNMYVARPITCVPEKRKRDFVVQIMWKRDCLG